MTRIIRLGDAELCYEAIAAPFILSYALILTTPAAVKKPGLGWKL